MPASSQRPSDSPADHKSLLVTALDHAWRWYDFRYSQAAHVLNFFTLGATVLTAAYVSAMNAGHYGIATAIALLGGFATTVTYVLGTRLTSIARLAQEPLRRIEDELAESLDIDSLRLVERRQDQHGLLAYSDSIANIMFPAIAAVCLAAAGFSWFGR